MTPADAAFVAVAVAIVAAVVIWGLTKIEGPLNLPLTWAAFALLGWGAYVLISTVVTA